MKLFESTQLGEITLKNRIVMAPMTRSRAIGNIPNDLVAQYYGQRATAGLIVTEGTSPSPNGLGYSRIPGMFTADQARAWMKTTSAVHAREGKIFLQLMHTGRVSHPLNLPAGARILAPSAIGLTGKMWTDSSGMQDYPIPQEMTKDDITKTIQEYAHAAELAIEAGFDGIELHGANGYLIEQFLNPAANRRTDDYGGTDAKRMRFALDVAAAVVKKIGGKRTGIRLSPYGANNDMGAFDGVDQFYGKLCSELSTLGLVYVHVVDHSSLGAPPVSPEVKALIRKNFRGSYILSGGYNAESAEADIVSGKGDFVAFGRPFISNPDLVEKFQKNLPLKEANSGTFYSAGPEGYTDY